MNPIDAFNQLYVALRDSGSEPILDSANNIRRRWMYIHKDDVEIAVEWRGGDRFMVSVLGKYGDPGVDLFPGPDEVVTGVESAKSWILEKLSRGGRG